MSRRTRKDFVSTGAALCVVALVGLSVGAQSAYADEYTTPLPTCDPIPPAPGASCMDDITTCSLNCTANDVRLAVYNVFGICVGGSASGNPCAVGNAPACEAGGGVCESSLVQCVAGEEVTVTLQAELIANAAERWDIGIFIALDGGDALTGECLHDFLNGNPLEPGTTGTCAPTCSITGGPCFKDDDCPTGEVCEYGYDPVSGTGPFYDGECTADPGDLCGDLEQGVRTYLNLDPITILCQDEDGNGFLDLGTSTSWDNGKSDGSTNKPSCLSEDDTLPSTPSKCRSESVQVGTIIVCDPADCATCEACGPSGLCEPIPGCCADDIDCPADGTCVDHFCDLATNTCDSAPIPNACDDGINCTIDECDEINDVCINTPDNNACEDGLYCNGTEVCDASLDCIAGTPVACSDGIDCTIDACDESTDTCTHTPNHAACSNGLYCDGNEVCDPVANCIDGPDPDCNDGVGCTIDACNEATDICTHTANDGACNDGQYCNGVETCSPTLDCQTGTPVDCGDGIDCTTDACDEGSDTCTHTPDHGVCSDGQYCNGAEICSLAADCIDGPDPSCGDGVGCTIDACDEVNDICTNTPNDTACDDGQYCTGVETCDPLNDCQPGTPVNCNDGVFCTVDSCSEANDTCVNTANSGLCNDGLYCTGVETCDPTNDCQPGTPVDCNDSIDCTADSCDDTADACVNTPNNTLCDDSNPCTDDACIPGTGCNHTPDDSNSCSDGLFCNGLETCVGGACQPGSDPCDDAVACTVDACDEATDTCTNTPNNSLCNDGSYCNGTETCDMVSDCQPGTPIVCSHLNDQCNIGVCDDDLDACVPQPANENQPCDDGLYCSVDEICLNGTCGGGTPRDCADGVVCTDDGCDEDLNRCTNTPNDASCDDGLYCTGEESCDLNLDCQDGPDPCVPPLLCDEPNDQCVDCLTDDECDDGLYCNGLETCQFGMCRPGTPVECDDQVGCTVDSCDDDIDACTNTPDDGLCTDGLYCSGVETCDLINDCQPGTPVNCNDGISCTIDVCDDDIDSCVNTADDSLCDDLLYCTGVETCDPTNDCQPGVPIDCSHLDNQCNLGVCDDTLDSCVRQAANETQPCDDGEFCTVGETCIAGQCNGGTPGDCADACDCTVDSCDEDNDQCVNTPIDNYCNDSNSCTDDTCEPDVGGCVFTADDTNICDDGLFCNGPELCLSGACQPGTDPCDDAVGCTNDICSEDTDACTNVPVNADCSDSLYCNGEEICDPALDCIDGADPNCDDGVGCTTDACNETADTCTHSADDSACDDSLYCTGVETCHPTLDCQPGTPVECADTIDCTVDACDDDADACTNTPNNSACSNGQFCDGYEICDPQLDCIDGSDPDCGDGIDCTVDSCNEVSDSCTHDPNHAFCSNGLYCDGSEVCDPAQDCVSGTAPTCNDGVGCTTDACNEDTDQCDYTPYDSACSDGLYCTGVETCDPTNDCQPGTPINCGDGVGCTVDECDDIADTCKNTATDGLCDDGLYCNGVETCNPTQDCQAGTPPYCADSVTCTVDVCNEATDRCTNTPNNSLCNDGDPCTDDVCDGTGCDHTQACGACCLPEGACTDDGNALACGVAGGSFLGIGTVCTGDSDGDGLDDLCAIPTMSQWGLAVVALLLLITSKIYFRREPKASTI